MSFDRPIVSALIWLAIVGQPPQLARAGFVGVQVAPVPDALRADLNLPADVGVLVQGLIEGGSAKAAGMRPNDVITDVEGHTITGVPEFQSIARAMRGGEMRSMRVRRGGQALTMSVPIQPRPLEHAPDVDTRYDVANIDGSLRRTVVTTPQQPGRHPALLYVNGIGCFTQESLDLASNDARLLYGLTRAGFVTMRVEKSGVGDSEGPACDSPAADFRAEMRGYLAGLLALERYGFVDKDHVFLVGLSIGGVEAPLIAAEHRVKGIAVINTVAKPLFEYLIDSRRRQMELRHLARDEIDRRMMLDERCNHGLLVEKRRPDAILSETPACADHVAYPAPYTFMQQWADINVPAVWKAVDVPTLVVYGTSDFVATAADAPYLADMINAFHPGRATLRAIPAMDHGMNRAASMVESYNRTGSSAFEPAVLEVVSAWLKKTAAP